ncbi:hypothetical protein JCM5350_000584 [Sporobolomyces pararoseus]
MSAHSDSDSDYTPHSPTPAFPPNRPPGDFYSHLNFPDPSSPQTSDDESDDYHGAQEQEQGARENEPNERIPERVGNFRLLAKHKLAGTQIHVAKWKSVNSGLSVIWADTPDLISSFATTVVTEIFDSSGVPHTKEHLTFTSSKHYPYSNVLDAIAGRLMTAGVNAATSTDNTTYTVESASEEGMLEIIPVYLDHILFPLMDENIFKTEIYHINGKGEEGGTVFSEMQGTEGSKNDMMALAEKQALYNFRNAYRYETGGMLPHLRNLTLKKITDYHKIAYVPQNITVVVTGRAINPRRLLETISQTTERDIEQAGLARGPHPQDWIRPFVESLTAEYDPIIEKDKTILVTYADTDTSTGDINISFVGPPLRDTITTTALGVLGDYLSGSSHSVLNRKFVEISEPACAAISFGVSFRDPTILDLTLSAVKKERLSTLAGDLRMVFKELCRESVDMSAMKLVIKQQIIGLERTLETSPGAYVRASALQDIIYGDEHGQSFATVFNDLEMLKALSKWTERDWIDLLKEYLVERHTVTLIGTPSPELVREHEQKDASRVAKNVRKFGPAGLAELAKDLEEAEKANKHPPPASLVASYSVPDFRKIQWLSVDTARSNGVGQGRKLYHGKAQGIINSDGPDLPFFVQFDNVSSNFVTVSLFLHGPALPILSLYVDTFFSMPVNVVRSGSSHTLGWQEVSRKLDSDLTGSSCSVMHEGILITLNAVKENYSKAVSWLSDLLYGTEFDVERLKNLVNTKLQILPSVKQDGSGVASCAVQSIYCSQTSVETPTNPIFEAEFYPKLKERLDKDPKRVVEELEHLRTSLLDPRSMRFSVVGDISKLDRPSSTWLDCFEEVESFPAAQLGKLFRPRELLTPLGFKPAKQAIVYRIDNSESTYLTARSRCPDWNHPDFAAIEVACSVLSQTNGLLWNVTRTAGLCYGSSIGNAVESGFLGLSIYRSPDAITALAAIRKLLVDISSDKIRISLPEVEAAKSEIAFGTIESESTPNKAASNSFFDTVILNKPRRFSQLYLAQIERVTVDDVHRVIETWIVPLTDSRTSIVGATTSPSKTSALVGGLTKLGYNVEQRHF